MKQMLPFAELQRALEASFGDSLTELFAAVTPAIKPEVLYPAFRSRGLHREQPDASLEQFAHWLEHSPGVPRQHSAVAGACQRVLPVYQYALVKCLALSYFSLVLLSR